MKVHPDNEPSSGTAPATRHSAAVYAPIVACAALLVASSVVFMRLPGIDLSVSGWFYSAGGGFFLGKTAPIVAIRAAGIWITTLTIISIIVLGTWWQLRPAAIARWPSATPRADWLFITAGMALGPGVLVNLIFKPLWGRARPIHIEQFGGHAHFTPAWTFSNQCHWGCSFVSGEAAASAFILAFVFIAAERWRRPLMAAGIAVTLAVSFARLAAGGHFLSDVVTAWLLIGLVMLILHAQIYHGLLLGPLKRQLSRWRPGGP